MSDEMMNTQEVARYLDIHEKQVYALIKAGRIPGTKVTGKWLFPKRIIDDWIESNAKTGLKEAKAKSKKIVGALLAAGSNDPVLDVLQSCLRNAHPEFYIFSSNTGSQAGLSALNAGYTDLAWTHLLDPETGEYNIPYVSTHLTEVKPVVVNLFHRELGFVTAPGNPLHIKGFEDLADPRIRLINRQPGSGTRVLLDYHLGKRGILPQEIRGYDRHVYTHYEVGLSIVSGESDIGIATAAVSDMLDLPFIPITRECFDMVLSRETFFEKSVQAFMEVLNSADFQKRVGKLGSYDFSHASKIVYAST
ncbi:MAG: helix-turn-helix transcriptional regulator [Syntrophaceae bacterium]|nr:helix-turn-helix transcriptional regulator [Syntrophaceae bacterium]